MADKPAPEEKKTPAAQPVKPEAAEPKKAAEPPATEPKAAEPAPGKQAAEEPAAAKPPAAAGPPAAPKPAAPMPAESKPAESKPTQPRAAGPAAAEPAAEVAADGEDRDALLAQWADEAQRTIAAHDKRVRRFLLRLSLANWGIAVIAWTVSAFLGITSPASIIVYSVLFVIGLVAAILAILLYLLEKFGHEPQPIGAISADEGDDEGDGDAAAAKDETAAPAAT